MYFITKGFTITAFASLFIVYLIGLIVPDLMEVDAAQYASISLEMAQSGSFLQVYHLDANYLDKPPLLFWLGALFMKLFGANHFAYRLPSFLFTIIGTYATFKLGQRLYNKNVGILSALFLASCQVYILHNHDVRTDTLLTNFVIIAIWQGITYTHTNKWSNLIWAFIATGAAMLAKGPIGAVVPVMAIGSQLIYSRHWSMLFNWRWLVGILIVLVVLSPMLYGLYMQFDADPTASVNGRTGVSGLRFFFWEQSFGRITGENVWKDDSSYFFFTHNYLWEFLPWSLLGIFAFGRKLMTLIKNKFRYISTNEMATIGGFIFPFIALSTSHYKLPHYIMVVMPMAAIFTASYVDSILRDDHAKARNTFSWVQLILTLLIGILSLLILYYVFPSTNPFWWLIPLLIFSIGVGTFFTKWRFTKLIVPSLSAVILMNVLMNGYFYPSLNQYQVGKIVGDWLIENEVETDDFVFFRQHYHNTYFYSENVDYDYANLNSIRQKIKEKEFYIYTNQEGLNTLKEKGITYQMVKRLYNFPNAELTPEFLNPKTRKQALQPRFIVLAEKE